MKEWLKEYESKWNIEILFACEAGSRAWGTDTTGSDLDIRFIYRHREIRSYLSLKRPIEVIDVNHPMDVHGWDLFKAFQLAAKSNPSLYEWAFSPIVYEDKNDFSKKLKQIIVENYSPFSVAMHYLSLMKRNLKEVSRIEELGAKQQKQFIQIVRSILIIHKIILDGGVKSSPIFTVDQEPANMWEHFYHVLAEAKKEETLLEQDFHRTMIRHLETEKISLEARCQELPKGKPFKEKLDQWLWELLRI